MISRKRIVLLFDSVFAYRSYSESGVHSEISSRYETEFIFVDTNGNNISEIWFPANNAYYLRLSRASQAFLSFFATAYWQRKSRESNSFRVRIASLLVGRRLFYSEPKKGRPRIFSIKTLLGVSLGRLNISAPRMAYRIAGVSIGKCLKQVNPDLILYTTLGGGIGLSDVIQVASDSISAKTLVLIDNWDNIYSKAVFNFSPDQVAVWNQRAKDFAFEVHHVPNENISVLPSFRLNHLIEGFQKESSRPSYVLFAGGSMHISFDARWLKTLHEELAKINPTLPLKYLPHPMNYQNLPKIDFLIKELGIDLAWGVASENGKVLPPLDLYPRLYKGSLCVISPLSTISLEAAILGIDSIGIDFFDVFEGASRSAFETFEHYWDLREYENFTLVNNENEMQTILQKYETLSENQNTDILHKPLFFKEELLRVIDRLILA